MLGGEWVKTSPDSWEGVVRGVRYEVYRGGPGDFTAMRVVEREEHALPLGRPVGTLADAKRLVGLHALGFAPGAHRCRVTTYVAGRSPVRGMGNAYRSKILCATCGDLRPNVGTRPDAAREVARDHFREWADARISEGVAGLVGRAVRTVADGFEGLVSGVVEESRVVVVQAPGAVRALGDGDEWVVLG